MKSVHRPCPSCGQVGLSVFYEVENVPVNSVLLVDSRQEALDFQRGDIRLAVCPACGFIANIAFDEALTQYSARRLLLAVLRRAGRPLRAGGLQRPGLRPARRG